MLTRNDWDPVPASLFKMIEASNNGRIPKITKASLMEWDSRLPLHKGVENIFGRLRSIAKDTNPRCR